MSNSVQKRRMLVVAKTYPELSSKYGETVCTAAVDENGEPLRLYPIPFRYLSGAQRFRKYQWISAEIHKSKGDVRPESFSVTQDSIELHEMVPPTSDEWGKRAESVLRSPAWQHSSMTAVWEAQKVEGRSIAFLRPRNVTAVRIQSRDVADAQSFEQKLANLRFLNETARSQLDLFTSTVPPQMKALEYLGARIKVDWMCSDDFCEGHSSQILDWEICELARSQGIEAARNKVEELLKSSAYQSAFILGNIHMYPQSFAIICLWYPPRANLLFGSFNAGI